MLVVLVLFCFVGVGGTLRTRAAPGIPDPIQVLVLISLSRRRREAGIERILMRLIQVA